MGKAYYHRKKTPINKQVSSGVPQGSIFGPIVALSFNDLPTHGLDQNTNFALNAVDAKNMAVNRYYSCKSYSGGFNKTYFRGPKLPTI